MAQADPQAQRLHYVMKCFNDVVINRKRKTEMIPPQIPTTSASLAHSDTVIPTAREGTQIEMPTTIPGSPNGGVSPRGLSHLEPTPLQQPAPPPLLDTSLPYSAEISTLSDNTPATSQSFGSTNSPDTLFDFQSFSFSSMSTNRGQTTPDPNDPIEIDFEALWNWPRTLSQDCLDQINTAPQGLQDGAVPLYSTEFMSLGGFQDGGQFIAWVSLICFVGCHREQRYLLAIWIVVLVVGIGKRSLGRI